MNSVTWPAAFLLATVMIVLGALAYKAVIPSEVIVAVVAAIVGYLLPRPTSVMSLLRRKPAVKTNAVDDVHAAAAAAAADDTSQEGKK